MAYDLCPIIAIIIPFGIYSVVFVQTEHHFLSVWAQL